MTIMLTSFVEARRLDTRLWTPWSAARWAPDFAQQWPVAKWAAPLRPDGTAVKLRDFGDDPLPKYRTYVLDLYRSRWPAIRDWVFRYDGTHQALCCWCPFTKTARVQLEHFGSFHCHLGVVAEVLSKSGVVVMVGEEHASSMVKEVPA